MGKPLLQVKNLESGYGKFQVLHDVSLHVAEGEIVSIIGPNGSGKSTLLKAVCGLLPVWRGEVLFQSKSIKNRSVDRNIHDGLTFSPQGNRVFDELTVRENLEIAGFYMNKDRLLSRIEGVLAFFTDLKNRLSESAGNLSGGEQQMLAFARALIPEPKLLLLDEPSLGLAPNLIRKSFEKLVEINRSENVTLLIVEQKVNEILNICDRVYSLKLGKIAFEGKAGELAGKKEKLRELFL